MDPDAIFTYAEFFRIVRNAYDPAEWIALMKWTCLMIDLYEV